MRVTSGGRSVPDASTAPARLRRIAARLGAMLRHEVNNPLQAILSEAELLAESEAGRSADVRAASSAIEQGAKRIAGVLAEFENLAERELADETVPVRPRRQGSTGLTRALAAELSLVARHAAAPARAERAVVLQARLGRAARLAQFWLASGGGAAEAGNVVVGTNQRAGTAAAGGSAAAVALAYRLQRLEAEHRELQRRYDDRERFWRFATHELRNAANAFVSWAYVLRRSEIRNTPWFAPLVRAAESVLRRAEEALELDAAGRGAFTIKLDSVNLVEAAGEALEAIRPLADQRNLTLAVASPPAGEPVWARADPDRLQQILHNLLRNAMDATPAGGSICLTARDTNDTALLEVEDSGPGFADGTVEAVYPADEPAPRGQRPHVGFGLGLPLSRYLAEQMGGSLVLEAGDPAAGARFLLRLPKAEP